MKIEEANAVIEHCGSGDNRCGDCPANGDGCGGGPWVYIEALEVSNSDKDRQIEELKSEALEMAELVSIIHPLGHDRAMEIIEKYTKESKEQNGR